MYDVLLRAASMTLVFALGMLLRSAGIVPQQASETVKKLALFLTIPASIIHNFSMAGAIDGGMVLVVVLGMLTNVLLILLGMFLSRGKIQAERAFYMVCLPSYSLGTFTIPFVQSFLPAASAVTASIFDVGNSLMCVGITPAFTAEYLSAHTEGFSLKTFFRRLCSSPPLVAYVIMYTLTSVHLRMPTAVLTLLQPMANANAFMCMMMLGLQFRLELKKEYLSALAKLLVMRNACSALFALFFYFALPFERSVRQTLVLLVFSPIAATAPAFAGLCGGDEGKASAANGISILLSILILVTLLSVMETYG